jgi:hypothetical protein
MSEPIDITLNKLKYRNPNKRLLKRAGVDPPQGTWVLSGKSLSSKSANSGKAQKARQGTGHRRKAYLGNVLTAS